MRPIHGHSPDGDLEAFVRATRHSPLPSAVRAAARLAALREDEARRFLRALESGGPAPPESDAAGRCAPRLERAMLVHRISGPGGPAWGVSARGRAFLAAPRHRPPPTWLGCLARLPVSARLALRHAAFDAGTAAAVAAFTMAWAVVAALDAAWERLARLDAGRRLG